MNSLLVNEQPVVLEIIVNSLIVNEVNEQPYSEWSEWTAL